MSQLLVTTCIVLFTCVMFVGTQVTVENGAYGNVLVSFSQNVPPNQGQILLEKLQDHLVETSNLLRNAVNLGISEVTFIIPRSWNTSEWNLTVEPLLNENDVKADIVVDDVQDSAFGNFPYAQQHGSCGTPGSRIVVPSAFLTEKDTFPKGTALAREWLKYRYGVFDENGYPGDELYPLYYSIPGSDPNDVIVANCTNTPVVYNFIDADGNNCTPSTGNGNPFECIVKPLDESLENVTSSLMYFHAEIPQMQHVCGKDPEHKHSSRSRNKHNSLCRGKSVWEVLETFSEFRDSNSSVAETESEESNSIQFKYALEPKPRVVIAWENTLNMKTQGDTVLKAIRKYMYDLPTGSKYAVFPFTASIQEKEYPLNELNNWPVDWKSIQVRSDYISPTEGCVNCAIKKALEILSSDISNENQKPAGTAVVVASSNFDKDDTLLQELRDSPFCLMLLVFRKDEISEAYRNYADASHCGTLVELSQDGNKKEVFEKLFKAMESILPETVDDKITETIATENIQGGSAFSFPVDAEMMEKVTFWILREELYRHTDAENVKAEINNKKVDLTEEDTSDMLTLSFSPNENGNVEFKLSEGIEALVQVRATSKPGKYVSGEILVHDTTKEGSKEQMPVIIYARVHFGPYPVQNADVTVVIMRPEGRALVYKLYDDGAGDPDITANDGVYSGYFINFTAEGEYKVTMRLKNKNDETVAGKLNKNGDYKSCCGSRIETGTIQLPSFEKTLMTTFNAVSKRPDDGYQPSRIVDLRVTNVTDDKVVLRWTAPGAEADKGTVTSYDIKYFTTEEELLKFENGKSINCTTIPQERGLPETCEVDYSNFENSMQAYIAIKSENDKTTSDTSNIIEVFIPDIQTTTEPEKEKENKVSKGTANTKLVGIIIGVILGLIVLVIIIYSIVYFAVVKPKRKQENKRKTENRVNQITNSTSQSHQLNPINSVSVDTLIRHHNEKERAKSENKPQPIYKEEDFEDNSTSRVEPQKNLGLPENTEVQRDSRNVEVRPPKSPKRTTNV